MKPVPFVYAVASLPYEEAVDFVAAQIAPALKSAYCPKAVARDFLSSYESTVPRGLGWFVSGTFTNFGENMYAIEPDEPLEATRSGWR